MQSKDPNENGYFPVDDRERSERAQQTFWYTLGVLYRWRRFIIGVTGAVAVLAVVLSLLMPNVYRSTARVLMPESGGGGLTGAMLRNLPAAASALLGGGGGGDYIRYRAILSSRTVREALVDSFDLVQVYELEESDTPREDAIALVDDYVEVELDAEYDYLTVSAIDTDPRRAADMANFLVRKLNTLNAELATQNARNYRQFIERRYQEAQADMDSVLAATQVFQEQYGVFDLPAQTQSFFEQIGQLRAQALQAEIQHDVLLSQYGPDNASVQTARQAAQAANEKYRAALAGREQLLPVPQSSVPEVARRYAELEMARTIEAAVMEIVYPMYEQARMQEEQKAQAVQVLDAAVVPVKKAAPRRSIIVIVATLSAFMLASLFALVYAWWQRNHAVYARRLQRAVIETERKQTPVSS